MDIAKTKRILAVMRNYAKALHGGKVVKTQDRKGNTSYYLMASTPVSFATILSYTPKTEKLMLGARNIQRYRK